MTLWFLARATGICAYLAFSVATALGALAAAGGRPRLTRAVRPSSRRAARSGSRQRAADPTRAVDRRFVVHMLHRSAAITGLVLVAAHVTAVVVDSYVDVTVADALIPLLGEYKTVPVAVGTIALWLTVLVSVWGFARGRLAAGERTARTWRAVHATAYAAWAVMLLHGLLAGTDRATTWARMLYVGGGCVVLAALVFRLAAQRRQRRAPTALVRDRSATSATIVARRS